MRFRTDDGFSLIELLIGVAVVSLLAALAIPNFSLMMAKSKQAEAKANLADIYALERQYHAEYGRYGSMDDLNWSPVGVNLYGYCLSFDNADCIEPAITFDMGAGDWGGDFGGWINGMSASLLPGHSGVRPIALAPSNRLLLGVVGLPLLGSTNTNGTDLPGGGNPGGTGNPANPGGTGNTDSGGTVSGNSTSTPTGGPGGGTPGGSQNSNSGPDGYGGPGGPGGAVGNPHYADETFEADAYGVIRDGGQLDCWAINQNRQLLNYNPGYH